MLVERARITELMGDSERAIQLLLTALHYAVRSVNPWDQLPVLAPLARLYYDQGLYPEGLSAARECVRVSHAMGDQTAHCTCVALLGQGELANGTPDEAEKQWLNGLHLAQEIGNIGAARELGDEGSVVHISDLLKKLYNAQGRTKEALDMAELWIMANDSVQRMAGQDVILKAEFLHEFLKDSLDHMNELQTSTKEHYQTLTAERWHRNIILVIGLAVFGIAVVLWGRARLLSKSNAAILLAQEKLVHSEKQREAWEVRTRIARDVHDQLGSDLTKLALLSGEAKAMAKQDPGSIPLVADTMERLAGEANRSLGDIVWAIDPHHDSLAGLTERVRAHCEHMLSGSRTPHVIDCSHTGNDRTLDPATKRDIYLIVRESLNNAVKHARSSHITIVFHTDMKRVNFVLQDNGIGFDTNSTGGHGLMNLKERAQRIGGELNVESKNGTTIRLTLVLK